MKKRRNKYGAMGLAFIILFMLRIAVARDPLADVIASSMQPIRKAFFSLSYKAASDSGVRDQESFLVDELDSQLVSLTAENDALRGELGFQKRHEVQLVGADVIAKSIQSYRKVLVIDHGAQDGIAKDMAVMADGYLIGIVNDVTSTSADILLINDADFRAAAIVEETRNIGIVTHEDGGVVLAQVARSETLEEGQRIVTSGLGELFRPGLPVGLVGSQIDEEGSVFAKYVVRLPFDATLINRVGVVVGP